MHGWDEIMAATRDRVQAMHEARELALGHARKLGQLAAKCIRHVHRHQFAEADALLAEAQSVARLGRAVLAPFPELPGAYLHDAEKEMVEAAAVLAMVRDEPFPTPESLGAPIMSYLNGMGEAASEVRRYALDLMRAGDLAEAERILQRMEMVYEDLITFDYSDAMTGGLRRTCDALRAVVERTRSDLTLTTTQRALTEELRRLVPKSDPTA
jgi:translin